MSYRKGKVYLKPGSFYRVGPLSEDWQRLSTGVKVVSFYNENFKASITTDAFCGASVAEKHITFMAGDMIAALVNRTVTDEKKITLGERGGVRQTVTGELDGVKVAMDLVVVHKDQCVFDFYAIEPDAISPDVKSAFETFFGGFQFE